MAEELAATTPSPNQLIAAAIMKLDCTTHEARATIDRRTRSTTYRVVIECPDRPTWFLLGALVEALGGRLQRNPATLALGVPIPAGQVLTIVLPYDPVSPTLPILD